MNNNEIENEMSFNGGAESGNLSSKWDYVQSFSKKIETKIHANDVGGFTYEEEGEGHHERKTQTNKEDDLVKDQMHYNYGNDILFSGYFGPKKENLIFENKTKPFSSIDEMGNLSTSKPSLKLNTSNPNFNMSGMNSSRISKSGSLSFENFAKSVSIGKSTIVFFHTNLELRTSEEILIEKIKKSFFNKILKHHKSFRSNSTCCGGGSCGSTHIF